MSVAAVAGAAGLATAAFAADEAPGEEPTDVSGLLVTGAKTEPESPKYVAPLLDTPQTITVVPREVIEAQNLMSLRDILSTVPGITFGAGEGGGGYGDSINLRGYSANSDITVDGVRDSAQYTRSDPFNLEQLEVVNGANSVYSGAGSVGGSINMVSKAPTGRDRTIVSVGAGTDGYGRLTVDANKVFGGSGLRLNAMVHQNDVPGRDVETMKRWGLAPSLTIGMMGRTRLTLSGFHQVDENTPQYGVPYGSNTVVNGPLPGVDPSSYYGYRNLDTQESEASAVTLRIDHDISDAVSLRNLSRWQGVEQLSIVDPPQGAWCLEGGVNAQTGVVCGTPGFYQPSGPRGTLRATENRLLYNQTDLTARFVTGGVVHSLTAGVALLDEDFTLENGNILRLPDGTPAPLPPMEIARPDNLYSGPVNYIQSGARDGKRRNQAVYLFDALELGERWELNGGVRFEHNEGWNRIDTVAVDGTVTPGEVQRNDDDLFSWRLGAVFKPVPNASLYAAFGNSLTPSQTSVSGGCSEESCNVDPEEAESFEVGGKWQTAGGRLLLTGAVFRNERSAFRVDSPEGSQRLDGRSRVDGISLGASGVIRDGWAVFANYTYLDSELLQAVSDVLIDGGTIDFRAGDPLPNTPEHALNLWTTVDLNERLQLGYGATYSGEYAFNRASAAAPLFHAPDYWVHNLALTWRATERAELRLNVRNVLDEEYYTRIRSAGSQPIGGFGWATPGDARNATLTLNYRF